MSSNVFVIILNWNGTAETLEAVASIKRQDYPNLQIVVVDNGSDETSVEPLLQRDQPFHLIRNATNEGFAGGCNAGIDHAVRQGAAYIWLFNSDATAPPDTLRKLIMAAEEAPEVGLLAPLVRDTLPPHALMNLGGRFDPATLVYTSADDVEMAVSLHNQFPEQAAVMGTALLIRRDLAERIGGMDETLFAYWEDVDYSIRSNVAGFHNRLVTDAVVFHAAKHPFDGSGQVKPHYYYYMVRNEILLLRKHGRGVRMLKALRWATLKQLLNVYRLARNEPAQQAALAGMWDGWRGRGGPYSPDRRMPPLLRAIIGQNAMLLRRLLGG